MADERLDLPAYKERVNFYGANGSGKSVLAAHMLAAGDFDFVAIDLKGDLAIPTDRPPVVLHRPDDPRWRVGYRQIVYRPDPAHSDGADLDDFLHRLYVRAQRSGKRNPFVVYVDETLALSEMGHTRWLAILAVAGRSLGVGLWCASQRPRWIPVSVRSEAWRTYVFFLLYEEDSKEVVALSRGRLTLDDLEQDTVNYAFLELRRGQGGRVLVHRFPPLLIDEDEE